MLCIEKINFAFSGLVFSLANNGTNISAIIAG